ncbi:MAG: DUF2341 domain-containing protein, partial [Verrucomicrobiota bacterium]
DAPFITNADGASNVTASSATLVGDLVFTGTAPVSVSVFWGTTNAGTNLAGWADAGNFGPRSAGPVVTNISGLLPDTVYYYTYYASNANGACFARPSESFFTGGFTIDAPDPTAAEEGLDPASFRVIRPVAAAGVDVEVFYVVSGSATAGEDFQPLSGSVWLTAGSTSAVFQLRPVDDLRIEATENVTVRLTPGRYGIGSPSNATAVILDNDQVDAPHKMKITFCGYTRPDSLTNFPALVTLSTNIPGFGYTGFTSPRGSDLRFLDASQTELLPHEVETWNTNGSSYIWVRVPELMGSNTCVWACWGDTNTPAAFNPSNVPGMLLWLDAENSGFTFTGSNNVDVWMDRSPNNNHATRNATAGTNAIQRVTNAINGNATVTFAGGDLADYLNLSFPAVMNTAPGQPGGSAFVVAKTTDTVGQDTIMSTTANRQFFRQNNNQVRFYNGTGPDPLINTVSLTTDRSRVA